MLPLGSASNSINTIAHQAMLSIHNYTLNHYSYKTIARITILVMYMGLLGYSSMHCMTMYNGRTNTFHVYASAL